MPKMIDMKTSDAIAYYGSASELARQLAIKPPSVSEWGKHPPPLRQLQLEKMTRGRLKAEKNLFWKLAKKAA